MKVYSSKSKVTDPKEKKKKGIPGERHTMTTNTPKTGHGGYVAGTYAGYDGPRVGGKVRKSETGPAQGTSKKKLIKKSKQSVRRSGASKAAKVAALRAYKSR